MAIADLFPAVSGDGIWLVEEVILDERLDVRPPDPRENPVLADVGSHEVARAELQIASQVSGQFDVHTIQQIGDVCVQLPVIQPGAEERGHWLVGGEEGSEVEASTHGRID
jgi:hypothetical protein